MTTDEAALALGISRFAIIRRVHAGTIPAERVGRLIKIDPALLRLSQQPKPALRRS
jgi:excisionase family DNA binding protein